ncbi:uncharacterized protein LOC121371649 isoform X2 [Gigantopelta aegis]|uniref:uncharacterized protein LOC121371649 isoform X2 n=1 Tax=Gigantopelta aegis TaxID=1735272 RepID=UPI001B88D7BB|nr:uncharacterized protein LOC121371649 isoform X2 [Gigantopelta aegis]
MEENLSKDSTTEHTHLTKTQSGDVDNSEHFEDGVTVFVDHSEETIDDSSPVVIDQVEEHIGDLSTASVEQIEYTDVHTSKQIGAARHVGFDQQSEGGSGDSSEFHRCDNLLGLTREAVDEQHSELDGAKEVMIDDVNSNVNNTKAVIDNTPQALDGAKEMTDYVQNKGVDYSKEVKDEQDKELHIDDAGMVTTDVDSSDAGESISMEENVNELEEKQIDEDPVDDSNIFEFEDVLHENDESRIRMFSQGLALEREGKRNAALKCYLGCLSNLQMDSNFALLPHCLRNIADIFFQHGEYEKAICFIQAEKLFYENALIDTTQIQKKLEEIHTGMSECKEGDGDSKISKDALRAEEYEHLAKLCMDRKQPQLALEYAGKATKIRQQIYGDDHQITKESLDYFATLYAEVGRHQYNESLSHLSEDTDCNPAEDETAANVPVTTIPRSPSSILRQRKSGDDKEKKQVRFQEPQETSNSRHQEEWISQALLCVLFAICFFLLFILGSWLYCNLYSNTFCELAQDHFEFYVRKIKYFYYQYASTKKIKYS